MLRLHHDPDPPWAVCRSVADHGIVPWAAPRQFGRHVDSSKLGPLVQNIRRRARHVHRGEWARCTARPLRIGCFLRGSCALRSVEVRFHLLILRVLRDRAALPGRQRPGRASGSPEAPPRAAAMRRTADPREPPRIPRFRGMPCHVRGRSGIVSRASSLLRVAGQSPSTPRFCREESEWRRRTASLRRARSRSATGPEGIAVDGEGRRGYVACARSDSVAVFDLDSREVDRPGAGRPGADRARARPGRRPGVHDGRPVRRRLGHRHEDPQDHQAGPRPALPGRRRILSGAPQDVRRQHGGQHGKRHRRRPARGHRDRAGEDGRGEPRVGPGPGPRLLRQLRRRLHDDHRRRRPTSRSARSSSTTRPARSRSTRRAAGPTSRTRS